MSSNCSKSTQIENRDTIEEFFDNRITKHLKNRDTMEEIVTKDSNWVTIVEIITKDSNWATIEEIITKESIRTIKE